MLTRIARVERALDDLRQGKMVILTDDPDRENEGDLVMAAEKITPLAMNFMIRHGSGIVCLSMTSTRLRQLDLPLMVPQTNNTSFVCTPFTISIDAKNVSGVSAADRVQTVQLAIADETRACDLARPGHIFPLQAKDGGVLEREGHTEGSVDLMHLAGLKPAAVICEIMNPDGTMARGKQIDKFAKEQQLNSLSIDDLIFYRLRNENFIDEEVSTLLPLENYGSFTITVIREKMTGHEHIVLSKNHNSHHLHQPILVRIHSCCTTGDLFSSQRCDCYNELHYSLNRISAEGGMLIYLNQEGRGIGLFNKIKAYALQEQGFDTVEANEKLGLPIDSRKYYIAANILRNRNITSIRLLTNNPDKIQDVKQYGINHVIKETIPVFDNVHNHAYLKTKKEKLHHTINFN